MKRKSVLKVVIASLLALACLAVFFGCDTKPVKPQDGKLPQQYINQRYYFQQGYRDDWGIIRQDAAEKYMVNRDTGLVMILAPLQMTKDESGNDVPVLQEVEENGTMVKKNVAVEGVEYCIYYYNGEGIFMTTSRADIIRWLNDESSKFFFNNKHYVNDVRDTFLKKGEAEIYTAQFSKLQFSSQAYTFVRDGEEWQGVYNLVMNGMEYFIVTFEAKQDLYDQYYEAYSDTIGDFRKKGWETSEVG